MATLPIANTKDKRIGLIFAVVLLVLTILFLFLMKYELPDPLPVFKKVAATTELEEIVLKDLKVEAGGAGGGTPNNVKEADPKPTRQEAITNTSKPSETTTTTGGKGTSTNSDNTTNTSGGNNSSNPFGDGGSGGGQGGGTGPGFGEDEGEGSGTGGIGFGSKNRTRMNNVDVGDIYIETDASIYYKLTVDSKGNVVAFSHISSSTTTTDLTLINKIGVAIKKQIKYTEAPGAPLEYQFYTIHVKAT